MKSVDGWFWPDHEKHLIAWMANPKNRMMINGRAAYQGKKQLAALALVAAKKDRLRTAIDVGGHVGLWSYNLAPAFQHVHAFEPVAYLRECFERNMDEQTVNVTLHPVALGAVEGSVSMHTTIDSTGDSWIKGEGDIRMCTLDSFFLEDADLIKIDTEGFEENVLRGAKHTIQHCRPVIIVEQKRQMAARFGLEPLGAVKFLQSLGYRVEQEIGGDFLCVAN